jgi:hypothetical protein
MPRSGSVMRWRSAWNGVLAGVLVAYAGTTAADPRGPQSNSQDPFQEVTVTAQKQIDKRWHGKYWADRPRQPGGGWTIRASEGRRD